MNYFQFTTGLLLAGSLMGCNAGDSLVKYQNSDVLIHDDRAPVIQSVSPQFDATDVSVDTQVSFVLSEAIKIPALSLDAVALMPQSGGEAIPGSLRFDSKNHILTFSPASTLEYGTQYRFQVLEAISDLSGNPLEEMTWSFTTEAEAQWRLSNVQAACEGLECNVEL